MSQKVRPDRPLNEARSELDASIIAQLIECGLVARYAKDPEGMGHARTAIQAELTARGWILPPYRDAD